MAVYIDKKDGRYTIKQWMLTDCESDQALPPMEEFYVEDPMEELDRIIPKGYRPIQYIPGAVLDRQNTWRKPMTKEKYDRFFDQMVDSPWHRAWKSLWLWQTFTWVYFSDADQQKECPYGRMISIDRHALQRRLHPIRCKYMQRDLRLLMAQNSRLHTHWDMWCAKILVESKSPGELIFADPEIYFEEAKKQQFPPLERFRMPRFKNHTKNTKEEQQQLTLPPLTNDQIEGENNDVNINDVKKVLNVKLQKGKSQEQQNDGWITLVYDND